MLIIGLEGHFIIQIVLYSRVQDDSGSGADIRNW